MAVFRSLAEIPAVFEHFIPFLEQVGIRKFVLEVLQNSTSFNPKNSAV